MNNTLNAYLHSPYIFSPMSKADVRLGDALWGEEKKSEKNPRNTKSK